MKKFVVALALVLSVISTPVSAAEISAEKKTLVKELMSLSGVKETAQIMARMMSTSIINVIRKTNPKIKESALTIIDEVAYQTVNEEMLESENFYILLYPIYDKYYSTDDLEGLLTFYRTPLGQKVLKTTPQVVQESAIAGQQFGQALGPLIGQRVKERLQKEGIKLNKI